MMNVVNPAFFIGLMVESVQPDKANTIISMGNTARYRIYLLLCINSSKLALVYHERRLNLLLVT